ncbi:hypothetical protein [Microvirga massiliensis]|uniref:hypothetical protein n=1 Tax=Microvirga massiliensis TaxID=1033741 RepID=UPI0011CCCEB9|nr:hypothetical protein [Microvirga massiliensis]
MNSRKTKSFPMTPENFARLRRAVGLLADEPGLRLLRVEAHQGKICFRLVLTEVFGTKIHPKDPAVVVGMSSDPATAMEIALAKGKTLIRAINQPVDHAIFRTV